MDGVAAVDAGRGSRLPTGCLVFVDGETRHPNAFLAPGLLVRGDPSAVISRRDWQRLLLQNGENPWAAAALCRDPTLSGVRVSQRA
jgi:hypothetical protein